MSTSPPRIHLVAGILERDGLILLAASRYANHARALWNLPGGRQRHGELLHEALQREMREETGLQASVTSLAYISESYDRHTETHFLCTAFRVAAHGEPALCDDAHVVDLAWVARSDLAAHIGVAVVREPLVQHLADERLRYFSRADAGITIEFSDPA